MSSEWGRAEGWSSGPALVWAMVLVVVSMIFGGGSLENPLRLALVELASVPLLLVSLQDARREGAWSGMRAPLMLLALVVLLPLAQMVPLPPSIWMRLPGHQNVVEALAVAGLQPGWRPMSLSPAETWRSALALIPVVAMMLGALRLKAVDVRLLSGLWILVAAAGVGLGIGQVLAPEGSSLSLYRITNPGALVGFFANRNHEASLLLALLPFAGLHAAGGRRQGARSLIPVLAWVFMLVTLVALGSVKSRAGVLLAGPAVVGTLLVVWRALPRGAPRRGTLIGLAAAAVAAVAAILMFSLTPTLQRFGQDPSTETRALAWPHVIEAGQDHAPLGAGLGAFDRVYRSVEPLDLVGPTYLNHAHNDYLEIWLEAGWPGIALVFAGLGWLAWSSWRAWRAPAGDWGDSRRAASVAAAILAAHSFVDYPLRTETLAVLMAFCCGILATGGRPQRAP